MKHLSKEALAKIREAAKPGEHLVEAVITIRFLTKRPLEESIAEIAKATDPIRAKRRCVGWREIKRVDFDEEG